MFADTEVFEDKVHVKIPPLTSPRRRVLFVDDELPILLSLKRALRSEFEIDAATGAAQALDYIENNSPYSAIVSDMCMPDEDGISFLYKVKTKSPATARIMLTGDKSLKTAVEAVNRGHVFRFLEKPCSLEVMRSSLLAAINEFDKFTEQERMAAGLLATFQHEFQTPLNHIVGFSSYLAEGGASDEVIREYAMYIQQSGQSLSTMTDQLLTLNQLNQNSYPAFMQWVSPEALTYPIFDHYQSIALRKNIALQVVIGQGSEEMFIDKDLMHLALSGLISNGIKFNRPGGRVVVKFDFHTSSASGPKIEVSDSGKGLEHDQLENLMRPFVQGDMSSTRKFGGIGIGLPLALAVAKFHKGELYIRNKPEGGLSTRLDLPRSYRKKSVQLTQQ